MNSNHIFIHSMWRTSSTYVWHSLRRLDEIKGFYEPYHNCLNVMTPENALGVNQSDLGHSVGSPYWLEYATLTPEEGGIPHYRRSFALRAYIPPEDRLPEGQRQYLKCLLDDAELHGKQACLGFVRSCMRAGAIRKEFGGVHIALIRNPFTQFTSCHQRSGFLLCIGKVVEILGKRFQRIGEWFGEFTQNLDPMYHDTVRFAIYYDASNLTALIHSHLLIDTDRLASAPDYRENLVNEIRKKTGVAPDFSNCVSAGRTTPDLQQHYQVLNDALISLRKEIARGHFQGLVKLWKSYPQTMNRHKALACLDAKRIESLPSL